MKITDLHIDGFGVLHTFSLSGMSPRLTIILGDNESGKSTLLAFIRRVLFGFPSKRKAVNHYAPVHGGEWGGRITVTTDGGNDYEITRYAKKSKYLQILHKDGEYAGNTISLVAGGADQSFFENVFAFGLDELETFDTLSDDAVQNRLMSAGAGVTKIPVPNVQKQLDARIEQCYKKNSKKNRVPEILKELSVAEASLHAISATQDEYDSLSSESEEIEAKLKRLTEEKRDMEKSIRKNENITRIWDEWITYTETAGILSSPEVFDSFPEEGIHQLEMLDAAIGQAEERIGRLEQSLKDELAKEEAIFVDEDILSEEERIRTLEKEIPLREADINSLPEMRSEHAASEKAFNSLLHSIDSRWTAETLLSFDISLPARQRVEGYQRQFREIADRMASLTSEMQRYEDAVRDEMEAIRQHSGELQDDGAILPEEELKKQEHALIELSAEIPRLDQAKRDLSALKEDKAKREEVLREKAVFTEEMTPAWPGYLMAGAALTSLGIGYYMDLLLPGALFCVVFGAAALVYMRTAGGLSPNRPTIPGTKADEIGLSRLISERTEEISHFEDTIRRRAEESGLHGIPALQTVSERRIELLELRKVFEKNTAVKNEIRRRQKAVTALEAKISTIRERRNTEESAEERVSSEWQSWLAGAALDTSLSPLSVTEIFTRAERAGEKYREMYILSEKITEKNTTAQAFADESASVMDSCRLPSRGSPAADVQALTDALKKQTEQHTALENGRKEAERIRREMSREEDACTAKKEERNDLFTRGHAEKRDEFLKNAEADAFRRESQKRYAEAVHRLKSAAGNPSGYDAFLEELNRTDIHELAEENSRLTSLIEEREGEINTLQQKHGVVTHRLSSLENEDEAVLLRMEAASHTDNLNDVAREWAKLVIARIILGKGIEKYEKERQPAVFREAERYFRSVTGGRYTRVIRPFGSDTIDVEDSDGRRIPAAHLSRGTAEQLYLSLRFGYITEYGRHDEHLPAIFDDILVNFDQERRRRSCEAIAELSENTQVIFFTCHPDTAQMLLNEQPDACVIEL